MYMLNPNISRFEISVDPDQLVYEKPDDQQSHCFPLCKYIGVAPIKVSLWKY